MNDKPLQQIDTGLWLGEGPLVNFHGMPYPTRMIIIRLPDGGLWVSDDGAGPDWRALTNRSGRFTLVGQARPENLLEGLPARLAGGIVSVKAVARIEDRRIQGRDALRTDAPAGGARRRWRARGSSGWGRGGRSGSAMAGSYWPWSA